MGKLVQHRLLRCRRNNHFVSRERVHEGLMEAGRRHTKAIGRTLLEKSGRRRIRSSPRNPDRSMRNHIVSRVPQLSELTPWQISIHSQIFWMPLWKFHSSTMWSRAFRLRYDMNRVIHKVPIHIDFGGQARGDCCVMYQMCIQRLQDL